MQDAYDLVVVGAGLYLYLSIYLLQDAYDLVVVGAGLYLSIYLSIYLLQDAYDLVVVGAGLSGAVIAERAASQLGDKKKKLRHSRSEGYN